MKKEQMDTLYDLLDEYRQYRLDSHEHTDEDTDPVIQAIDEVMDALAWE